MHLPNKKGQSALEFITTYSWAFLILTIFLAVAASLILSKNTYTYTPASCYIEPELPCTDLVVMSRQFSSEAVLIFTNNLGIPISFSSNPLEITPEFSTSIYTGSCYPSIAPVGSTVYCIDNIGLLPSIGTQVNLDFNLRYQICRASACGTTFYNTSGTATTFVSPYNAIVDNLTLYDSPATGNILVSGVPYPSANQIVLLGSRTYPVYALPPSGYYFSSWLTSSNVLVSNSVSQAANLSIKGDGTITAIFNPISISSASTSAIGGSSASSVLSSTMPYQTFLCVGSDGGGPISKMSWFSSAGSPGGNATTGYQDGNSCSASSQFSSMALGEIGVYSTAAIPLPQTYVTSSSGSFISLNYKVASSNSYVYIMIACSGSECSGINLPSGCSQSFLTSDSDARESVYGASCLQNAGEYYVRGSLSGTGEYAASAYVFSQ